MIDDGPHLCSSKQGKETQGISNDDCGDYPIILAKSSTKNLNYTFICSKEDYHATITVSGFLAEASIGAVAILAANTLLRPLAQKVNKAPTVTEEESQYCIDVTCRSEYETHVLVSGECLTLYSLHSEDLEDQTKVIVEARLLSSTGCTDHTVEKIVSRVSLESGVTAVSWKMVPRDIL